jgi:hypothetical protein
VRVVLLDPSAFTLPYDHHLATALARRGLEVELVASRFRFGEPPAADGYSRRELFYPLSSRLFRRSPLRLPLKVAEHAAGLARLRTLPRDVLHVQWAPLPALDRLLLPLEGAPSSPRTTFCRAGPRRSGSSGAISTPASAGSSSTAGTGAGG